MSERDLSCMCFFSTFQEFQENYLFFPLQINISVRNEYIPILYWPHTTHFKVSEHHISQVLKNIFYSHLKNIDYRYWWFGKIQEVTYDKIKILLLFYCEQITPISLFFDCFIYCFPSMCTCGNTCNLLHVYLCKKYYVLLE